MISNSIHDRPQEATNRQVIGHWEADTMAGKAGSACLVAITDRCSRLFLAAKVDEKHSALVADEMIALTRRAKLFQGSPPRGGRPSDDPTTWLVAEDFNPRPPRGGRPLQL